MPLRDHFRPPVWNQASWEGFHGMWPCTMVQQLSRELPPEIHRRTAVHLGSYFEIDVCAYEQNQWSLGDRRDAGRVGGCGDGHLGAAGADVGA